MRGSFNITGNIVTSDYSWSSGNNYDINDNIEDIDANGNGLYFKYSQDVLTDVGTSGAWHTTDPDGNISGQTKYVLYKKNTSGAVLWKTYLPAGLFNELKYIQDDVGNVYLLGTTEMQQGITTSGTLQPNYEIFYQSGATEPLPNGFILKIGNNGELVWGTYFPSHNITRVAYYNNHLYVVSQSDTNTTQTTMATPNTWQTTKAGYALTKLDTATGNRVWGTYIGNPANTNPLGVFGVKANQTGVYLFGHELNYVGSNPNYFATPGSHKPQHSGVSDYFLTRLTLDGNRIWGTYFGSDDYEQFPAANNLSISDNAIFIAGNSTGSGSNIATPVAFVDTKPNNSNISTNLFFAKFDMNGNQQWCSYYGGASNNPSIGAQDIGIVAEGNNRFYLYGSTTAATGIATPGTYQTQLPQHINGYTTGFLARFDLRTEMSTADIDLAKDLQLYDNPNNGNFSLNGSVLTKQQCKVLLYDTAGRLVYQKELPKQKTLHFQLDGILPSGNYVVQVNGENKEKLKVFKMVVKN